MRPILLSLGFLAATVAVYVLFIRTEAGQRLDASSFGAVVWLRASIGEWSGWLRDLLTVVSGVILSVLLIVALLRQRLRDATAAAAVTALSLIVSTLLKNVLERPFLGDFGYLTNTFPSSRAAVTVAALIGSYWLLPDRLRRPVLIVPLLLLGSVTGMFQVVSYAHRPGDVLGGVLLAGMFAALFVGPAGALHPGWRWTLWIFVALASLSCGLCLSNWESSGYATSQQMTATVGILLASAACVAAALAVGAERPIGHPSEPIPGEPRLPRADRLE